MSNKLKRITQANFLYFLYFRENGRYCCYRMYKIIYSPADLADLRRQTPKQQNSLNPKQPVFLCEIIQLCCIPLRDLRNLRENIHMRVLNLLAQIKPQKSPADLADLRRQNTNNKTTITAIISQPSPICLSLRNNAAMLHSSASSA